MEKSSSAINFHKKLVVEKLDRLEKDIKDVKDSLVRIEKKIDKVNRKTPTRAQGWFGDYKTYED